jgi:hypothetical protein
MNPRAHRHREPQGSGKGFLHDEPLSRKFGNKLPAAG